MADDLREIIDTAKREMPDVPADVWARFERVVRINFGATRPYVAAQRKRAHLEMLADIGDQQTAASLAEKLGLGVRRVQQLKKLK